MRCRRLLIRCSLVSGAILLLLVCNACAKRPPAIERVMNLHEVPMVSKISTFKGLAYVIAERHGIKWANNVAVLVKNEVGLRLDALERITDVVATLIANKDGGILNFEGKKESFGPEKIILPQVGEVSISAALLSDILIGRPSVEGGATVTQAFHTDKGSYFIKGRQEDLELSNEERMPLVYTRFADAGKRRILYEAAFEDFMNIGSKKFPRHILIRFEHPKMMIDIQYRQIWPDAPIRGELLKP